MAISINNFPAGENVRLTTHTKEGGGSDPYVEHAGRVLRLRADSVIAQVQSTVALSESMDQMKESKEQQEKFFAVLCNAKVLTKADAAAMGGSDSTQSKWKKICQYASFFLDERVLPILTPGYTVMYELALLIQDLEAHQTATERFSEFLATLDGPITKRWIQKQRNSLNPPKQVKPKKTPSVIGASGVTVIAAKPLAPPIAAGLDDNAVADAVHEQRLHLGHEKMAQRDDLDGNEGVNEKVSADDEDEQDLNVVYHDEIVKDDGQRSDEERATISAVLLTINKTDARRLAKQLKEGGKSTWMSLASEMASDSALFIFTKADTLFSLHEMLSHFGSERCANVYLLSEPHGSKISDCELLTVYERGDGVEALELSQWKTTDSPVAIVQQLLNGVEGRRVHLFAEAPTPGWETFTGEANW